MAAGTLSKGRSACLQPNRYGWSRLPEGRHNAMWSTPGRR